MPRARSRNGHHRPSTISVIGLLLFAFSLSACGGVIASRAPRAVDGRLDLSHWDFESEGDVALLGTWEICWNRLLEPGGACPAGWRPVPVRGLWSEEVVGSPFGGRGVATYRLRVELPPQHAPLALVVGGPLTAHRLWIDGVERGDLGVVGPTAETTVAAVFNRVYELTTASNDVEIQVEVANFEFRGGGLRRIWYLGQTDSIQRGIGLAILREAALFAVGLVVGLGFLTLFALRPSELARGYFGMFSLVLGLRAIPASISTFGELMAPWMSWDFAVRAEYLGMALASFAAVGYVQTKVAGIMPPRTTKGLQILSLAYCALVVVAPMPIVLASLPFQYVLPPIVIGLVLLCYGRAWLRGVPGAAITTVTALLYVGLVVHDILRTISSASGAPIELFPYGVVLWILAEAYQLLRELHASFEQVETLSKDLSEANFELQETEAAIVRFVPFDFLRSLGKRSIRDVEAGDHAGSQMSILHCALHAPRSDAKDRVGADLASAFERINELVGRFEPCIHRHAGFLNDYQGDGFQAFFPDGARDAVEAAVDIMAAARHFNAEAASKGQVTIDVGIGIDSGEVQLGTVGSGEHLVRCVVGEPVDSARRIASLTLRTGARILIGTTTRERIGDDVPFEIHGVGDGEAVGAEDAIELFEVVARENAGEG